jgi:hypothetical protein
MLGFHMFQTKINTALLKVFHSTFGNSLKKFCFNKIVQGMGWLLKILHHESRHSTMSRFNKFQVRIYSALCKLFHSVFGNSPKKFRAIRVQIKQLGTSSINLKASSWSTSINEWIVKRIEGLLGKMLLMIHFGAVSYKSCHHQLLAGYSMLRKFKYLQRIIKSIWAILTPTKRPNQLLYFGVCTSVDMNFTGMRSRLLSFHKLLP